LARSNVGYVRRMDRVPYQRQCAREPRRMRAQQGSATVKALSAIGVGAVGAGVGEYLFAYRKINGATQLERAGSHLSNMEGLTLAYHRALPAVTGAVIAEAPFVVALMVARLFTRGRRTAAQVQKITPSDVLAERKLTIAPPPAAPGALPDILVRRSNPKMLAVSFSPSRTSGPSVSIPVEFSAGFPVKGLKVGDEIKIVTASYMIERELGKGGMGRVWLARNTETGENMAIKELITESDDSRARILQEADAIRKISQRPSREDGQWEPKNGVVRYRGTVDIEGTPVCYVFMEYLPGPPLGEFIYNLEQTSALEKTMDQPAIARQLQLAKLNILDYLARSLQFVLEVAQIIHRDLKYENIKMQQNSSGQYFPVILDWGLVKDLAENLAGKKGLSVDGAFQGTFNYMAPEIIWAMASTPEGEIFDRKNIDHRVDIYALGVILYRMMVGKVPIEVTLENFIRIHTQKEAPEIIIPADIPPKTAALIKKMLARYPKDRPQTYAELIDLINDAKSEISGQN